MGQKDNENVVMLAPMTFRALEAIITHDPPEYLLELKDPLPMMRNVQVHGVRPIYLESLPIHTEHCGQQDNPIHALLL